MEPADGSSSSAVSGQTSLDTASGSSGGSNSTADSSIGSHNVAAHGEIFAMGENIDSIAYISDKIGVEPQAIFDLAADLPPWLHQRDEHEIFFAEGVPSPAPPHRTAPEDHADTYWVKVSSVAHLRKACLDATEDIKLLDGEVVRYLHVHILPSISLKDVDELYTWSFQEGPCENVAVYITNGAQFSSKWESYRHATKLLEQLTETRKNLLGYESEGIRILGEKEKLMNVLRSKQADEASAVAQYNAAKSAFISSKENQQEDLEPRRVEALAACNRMFAAKDMAKGVKEAVAGLEYLAESVEQRQAALEEAMGRLTLMGCGLSDGPANGGGAGDGGGALGGGQEDGANNGGALGDGQEDGGDDGDAPADGPEHGGHA